MIWRTFGRYIARLSEDASSARQVSRTSLRSSGMDEVAARYTWPECSTNVAAKWTTHDMSILNEANAATIALKSLPRCT